MNTTINLIRAEDLYYDPIRDRFDNMVVQDLLPAGLTILAGAPKSCKSWMMLDLCLCVTSGEPFMGHEAHRCEALYFALEDTAERLQKRLLEIGKDPQPGFYLKTAAKRLDTGFVEELETILDEHSRIRLVIIDTFQKIRAADRSSCVNQYAKDDLELTKLKRIADQRKIAIVIVHHLRKMKDSSDPVNDISGSVAITGSPDTVMILRKDRSGNDGVLTTTGRDISPVELTLRWEHPKWSLVEEKTEEQVAAESVPDILYRAADFIRMNDGYYGTMSSLLEALGETETPPNVMSRKMNLFFRDVFLARGITFSSQRSANERKYSFIYHPLLDTTLVTNDGNDDDDGHFLH